MADQDELVIEMEGDLPDTGKEVSIEPDKKAPDDAAVAGFKKQLEDAQAEREAANKRAEDAERRGAAAQTEAEQARQREAAARGETVDSQLDAVSNALNAAQAESAGAEAAYAAAMESGDFKGAAAAQKKMATAEAQIVRLGDAKYELEGVKKAPPKAEQRADPIEQFITSRPAPVQTWLRGHMNVLTDPQLGTIANGAHAEALRKGLSEGTPEYFELVETRLGFRQEAKKLDPEHDTPAKRKPMQSAPMSRENNANGNNGAPHVTLSRGEQATATDGTLTWTKNDAMVREGKAKAGDPIGIKEMARRKHAMQQSGYYNRAAVE